MDPISMSASLITILALIVQTVDAVRKSHDLYSSVKDAPGKLRLLLDELQMLNNLLVASQETALHTNDHSLSGFLTALTYCRDALESVRAFSTDLENSILRAKRGLRQWATVKVVFSDRKLKRHLNRLERAKSMLSLAHQMCMQSQMSHVTQLQQQMMLMPPDYITAVSESIEPRASVVMSTSIEQATRPSEPDHEKHLHRGSNLSRRRDMSSYNCVFGNLYISWTDSDDTPEDGQKNDQEVQHIVFRSHANRFLSKNFSLLCERSFGAWKISLRSVSNFRIDDPLYRYCASGDLSGIQRLFRSRRASPSDMTHHGYTPLHIAAAFGNAETCRFLLAQGADADAAATSEWVREVGSETMLIFEAGSGLERQKTPLARIVEIANEFDSSSEALELQHDITNRVIDEWLRTLDAAGVDLQQYVDEEERLIRCQDDDRQWEPYLYDDGLEYQVKWYWRDRTDDRCRPVSVRYVWRHAPNQAEEMGSWPCDGFTVPGGWVEENE
ncbi:MAG: hypothetical protein Q9185_006101 [Variospora sp. 1 TL-2023]